MVFPTLRKSLLNFSCFGKPYFGKCQLFFGKFELYVGCRNVANHLSKIS